MPHQDIHNEQDLLQKISAGDQKAFNTLYHLYSQAVFATAHLYLKDSEKAKESVQLVFIKLWEKRARLTGIGSFTDYLFILARNTIFDQLKKDAVEDRQRLHIARTLPLQVNDGDYRVLEQEYTALLQTAIGKLPPQQQQVYLYAREQLLSYEEIAGKMQLSRATVKKHMELALRFIRKELNSQMHSYFLAIALLAKFYS